ncbi:MAG: M24 family metallopeptidase [Thermodesulfobacteriota bacterium]
MVKIRLERLRAALKRKRLDGLLVTHPANRRYLSDFLPGDGQFGESSGALLVTQSDALLLTDFRYALSAAQQAPLLTPVVHRQGLGAELKRIAQDLRLKKLGFEADALLVSQQMRLAEALSGVELVPTTDLVAGLRIIKHPDEVAAISASLALIEGVLDGIMAQDLTGRTERAVAGDILRGIEQAGGEGPSFAPIVASGPNAAEPHAEPGGRVIQPGDSVILDVGAKLGGYCSDITRTMVAGGPAAAPPEFKAVYATVRRALEAALAGIRPGMSGKQADALGREVIEAAGHGQRFGHSLGHGVGLMTHEDPHLSPVSTETLKAGMVFTIEPGIYLPGWGGVRLEQTALLTPGGCRLLNRLDRFYDL